MHEVSASRQMIARNNANGKAVQNLSCCLHCALDFRIEIGIELFRGSRSKCFRGPFQCFRLVLGGKIYARDVVRVVSRYHTQHHCSVLCPMGHGAAVVGGVNKRHNTANGDQSIGWLQSNHAAPRTWNVNGTAGVCAQCTEAKPSCSGAPDPDDDPHVTRSGSHGGVLKRRSF